MVTRTPTAWQPLPTRLHSLTGLRAVAALSIFVLHVDGLTTGAVHRVPDLLMSRLSVGVSFFFLLSGFVMAWGHAQRPRPREFWRRRLARIYPVYFVTVVAGFLVVALAEHRAVPVGPVVASVLLVQAWVPDPTYFFAGNSVAWSLSCEAFFYAVFPLVLAVVLRSSPRGRLAIALTAVSVTCAAGLVGSLDRPDDSASLIHTLGYWLVYVCPLTRCADFVLGVLVSVEFREGRRLRLSRPVVVAAGCLYVFQTARDTSFGFAAVPLLPLVLLLLAAVQAECAGRPWRVARPAWVWAGGTSYCFYLVHDLLLRIVSAHLQRTWAGVPALLVIVAALAAAVAAAYALHQLVELPFDLLLRSSRARRPLPDRTVSPRVRPARPLARPTVDPVGAAVVAPPATTTAG